MELRRMITKANRTIGTLIFLLSIVLSLGYTDRLPGNDALKVHAETPENSLNPTFDLPGDASGHFDMNNIIVYGFSHNGPIQEDPQLYEKLVPDIATRGWLAGWMENRPGSEYHVNFLNACHAKHILFMGGITGSAVFPIDAKAVGKSDEEFLDWITRDAQGQPVEHTEAYIGLYRGSLANPKYRAHLVEKMKMQIDLGVDGITVDETDGNYNGGKKWNWNGNEGYDDYFIADFNRYLMEKYPDFTAKDWKSKFRMRPDNMIKRDVAYNDLNNNFNYRKYLKQNQWDTNPLNPANPLAKEWGPPVYNRVHMGDLTFMQKATRLYWKDMVMAIRNYARQKYHKEILITGNGIYPYVDYNSLGMYNYNMDDDGREADYVPVTGDGHLNGKKSLKAIFKKDLALHRMTAGNVPLLVFIDWPTKMIDSYYKLPVSEKEDLWQIYMPEAYACGLFYAFHLKTCEVSDPTATQSGVIDFMASYADFYKNHKALYQNVTDNGVKVSMNRSNVEYNVMTQPSMNRWLLHLINHNYNKEIIPQNGLSVSIPSDRDPKSVSLISPDISNIETVDFRRVGKNIQLNVKSIKYYDILVINW